MLSDAIKKTERNQTGSPLRSDQSTRPPGLYGGTGKRAFDIIGATGLLLVFMPLLLLLGCSLSCQRGPLLFGHWRMGRRGHEFRCLKFRTMVPDADRRLAETLQGCLKARQEWQASRKLTNDPRITRIGHFLRRTSLDELPQLLNVLRGDMSLVGPRPVPRAELELYGPAREAYLSVRPGLTGLWQVSGRNDISYAARVAMDEAYVHDFSFAGDLAILCRTVLVVLGATGK